MPTLIVPRVLAAIVLGALALYSSQSAMAAGRVLSVDDVLQIKVVNQPDLDTTARVEPDGTINYPYVGRIMAAGRSEDNLAERIAKTLREREVVKDPHVLVEIATFGSQATVQGEVGLPGAYPIDRPTTLTQILAKAGGFRENAGVVVLRRPGPKGMIVTKYLVKDIASGRVDGEHIQVFNNDEIYVELAPFFYVYGYVNRTGEFPLIRSLTVQQALAISGGLAPLGSDWRIQIKRRRPNGTIEVINASLDDEVEPNDTIVVNERLF
jgi:polysaccharide export outer membrane protein